MQSEIKSLHKNMYYAKSKGNLSNVSDLVVINELLKKLRNQELEILRVKNEIENFKGKNHNFQVNQTCLECSLL